MQEARFTRKSEFYKFSTMYQSSSCNTMLALQRQSTRRCLFSKLYHSACPWISLCTAHAIFKSINVTAGSRRAYTPARDFLETNKFDQKYKHCGGANLHRLNLPIYQELPTLENARSKVYAKIRVLQIPYNVPK